MDFVIPRFKHNGAVGVVDSFYSGEALELRATDDAEYQSLISFVRSGLSGIVNGVLPIEEDFGPYRMRGADELGFAAVLRGRSPLESFANLPSRWTRDMVGVVSLEMDDRDGKKSIIMKASGFVPEDAAACLVEELLPRIKRRWPKTARLSGSQSQEGARNVAASRTFNHGLMWGSAGGLYFLTAAVVFLVVAPDNRPAFLVGCLLLAFRFLFGLFLGPISDTVPFLVAVLFAVAGGWLIAWREDR
ncbi:MAG: hypothetical protein LBG60_01865 [Bifidobacteriaceae bacterium]|jgi:hypothetical protein|nr:hypothetical protein [Bifidobacteriaceae bacterium]